MVTKGIKHYPTNGKYSNRFSLRMKYATAKRLMNDVFLCLKNFTERARVL